MSADSASERAWVAKLREDAQQSPSAPRVPLWSGNALIGSVEPGLFAQALPPGAIGAQGWVEETLRGGSRGWQVHGELAATLALIANAMSEGDFAHTWRNEQLAVGDDEGLVLASVERGVVRQLGITTHAVHLIGITPDGKHWVQQRSLTKPNDPGLWDTLMGGMVPASDTLAQSLERETWEEAGLRMDELRALERGGRITTRRPAGDHRAGYVVEHIEWFRCIVPLGVVPCNQDGEVAQFALMTPDELRNRLLDEHFTTEAALIFADAGVIGR